MAERRMFAKSIVISDAFLDMPATSRCLYFTLAMFCDDDGFCNNPKSIMRQIGATIDDMNILIAKKFILAFENGVIVIKHWKIHNYIRSDRYKPTKYQEEKSTLSFDENGAYTRTLGITEVNTVGIPDDIPEVDKMDTQVRLGKDRLGKDNIYSSEKKTTKKKKEEKHKYGEFQNVLLTDTELNKLKEKFTDYHDRIERLSLYVASTGKVYKSHYATILAWAKKDPPEKQARKIELYHEEEVKDAEPMPDDMREEIMKKIGGIFK